MIDALSKLPEEQKAMKLWVWLPGSIVELSGEYPMTMDTGPYKGVVLVEGNLKPGSALDTES
jgi:hypothetical protein